MGLQAIQLLVDISFLREVDQLLLQAALVDFGRPRAVRLAVLIDREGMRELPIQADVVGRAVSTTADEKVVVQFESVDGVDEVSVVAREAS